MHQKQKETSSNYTWLKSPVIPFINQEHKYGKKHVYILNVIKLQKDQKSRRLQ